MPLRLKKMTYFTLFFFRYFQRLVFMTRIPKTNIESDFCEVIRSTTKPIKRLYQIFQSLYLAV